MPIFTKDGRALLFAHVPKTGGTAIEQVLTGSGWEMILHTTARKEGADLYQRRRCSPQHYHGALLREMFHVGSFDVRFMIVRDPIARFRSEYAFRAGLEGDGSAEAVSTWADPMLDRLPDRPYLRDNHLRAQHEFLVPRTEVYRFEDGLDAIVEDLNARFDLGLAAQVPHVRHKVGRRMESQDVEIDPVLEKRLRQVYATDFSVFEYDVAPAPRCEVPRHRLHHLP